MGMLTHWEFEVVKLPAAVALTVNGKKTTRKKTFSQTINPFNQDDNGKVKTRSDIMRELKAEAEAWREELKKSVK